MEILDNDCIIVCASEEWEVFNGEGQCWVEGGWVFECINRAATGPLVKTRERDTVRLFQ